MTTLYFECGMGAAGDMLMAALLELHGDPEGFLARLNAAGVPGVTVSAGPSVKCGVAGTHVKVMIGGREEEPAEAEHEHHGHEHEHEHEHAHEHAHSDYHGIGHLIERLNVSGGVKAHALEVYRLIAEAESRVHGTTVEQIHFHEVGELDAVADIVGVCMLMEELAPEAVAASPVNTGSGFVRCAHGILPVPAPATAAILRGMPIYNDQIAGELCTPTGAALLKHFAGGFGRMPVMAVSKIGYGMGSKDFERANCVRAYIGEAEREAEEVAELVCNLDDMTPEAVAFAAQLLLDEGAVDVYTTAIGMKKGRMGVSFTCMCRSGEREKMLSLIFKHTSTLGIREYTSRRYALPREETTVQTRYGAVRVKTARVPGGEKSKPEYEDAAKIARERGISLQDVFSEVKH